MHLFTAYFSQVYFSRAFLSVTHTASQNIEITATSKNAEEWKKWGKTQYTNATNEKRCLCVNFFFSLMLLFSSRLYGVQTPTLACLQWLSAPAMVKIVNVQNGRKNYNLTERNVWRRRLFRSLSPYYTFNNIAAANNKCLKIGRQRAQYMEHRRKKHREIRRNKMGKNLHKTQ